MQRSKLTVTQVVNGETQRETQDSAWRQRNRVLGSAFTASAALRDWKPTLLSAVTSTWS